MSGMDLHIDDNLVRPVIEKEIQAAIVREMDKQKELLPLAHDGQRRSA